MSLGRRTFLMGALAGPALAQKGKRAPERPNIVLVIADDLASWMLGCYGNKEIRTPNIDRFARMGTRFVNHYCCTPICSASRATIFTGRLPRQHGIVDFLSPNPVANPPQGQAAPPPSFEREIMISDLLAGAGYNCGYMGKWHMGNDQQPQHQFKNWYTMLGGSSRYQDPQMSSNGQVVQEKGYLADLITARACRFIDQQQAGTPFFLTVSHFNPHTPYEGHPAKYYEMYGKTNFDTIGWQPPAPNALREKNMLTDIVGNIRRAAAATTALDDQIGVLMAKLRERQIEENTLVIFTGDNGYLLGRHGLWSKGLASDPINMYEEVMQVPMLWRWVGHVPADNTRPDLVSFYDFVPTLADVTGVPVPADRKLTGRSYYQFVNNRPLPRSERWPTYLYGEFRNTFMVRDSRYKLVERNDGRGPNELYDLRTDLREHTNQYANPQFIVTRDRLSGALAEWRKRPA